MNTKIFFGGIVLIVAASFYLKYLQISSEKKSSTSMSADITKRALFTPDELSRVTINYRPDNVAGEAIEKGFIGYVDAFDRENTQHYFFLEEEKKLYGMSSYFENMSEHISFPPSDSSEFIYTVKSKTAFLDFVSQLKANNALLISEGDRWIRYPEMEQYIYGNALFIVEGYSIKAKGYSFIITPENGFKEDIEKSNRPADSTKQVRSAG